MATSSKKLNLIASGQHGYFTAKQAKTCGYSNCLQSYHCRNGNWQRYESALYRLPGFADTPEAFFVRWGLWSRNVYDQPQAVISHYSALWAHQLWPDEPATVCLTVPPSFRKATPPGCVIHKASLPISALESRPGFLVTNLTRTLEDLRPELQAAGRWTEVLAKARQRGGLAPETARRREPGESGQPLPSAADETGPAFAGAQACLPLTATQPPAAPLPEEASDVRLDRERIFAMIRARTQRAPHSFTRRRQAGFTLVELLVVAGIISVLCSLLLPVLGKALASARGLKCANQLKQIGLLIGMYGNDFSDWLPPAKDAALEYGNIWSLNSQNYLGFMRLYVNYQPNPRERLAVCPEYPPMWYGQGGNYGLNAHLFRLVVSWSTLWHNQNELRQASAALFASDVCPVDDNPNSSSQFVTTNVYAQTNIHYRHNGLANMLKGDLHAGGTADILSTNVTATVWSGQ